MINKSRLYQYEQETLVVYKELVNQGKIKRALQVLKTAQKIRNLMQRFYNYKPLACSDCIGV